MVHLQTYQCIHSLFHLVSGGPFNGVPSRFPSLLGLTFDVCNMNSLSHIKLRKQKEEHCNSQRQVYFSFYTKG